MNKLKNASALQIIVSCSLLFAMACFLALWIGISITTEPTLTQIPSDSLPEKPTSIVGIDLPRWYDADPIIQTESGATFQYSYNREIGTKDWIEIDSQDQMPGTICNAHDEAIIAKEAEPIIDCQTIQLIGEWCPPPINIYGLTEDGTLWELRTPQPCMWVYFTLSFFAGIGGLILGSIIVIARYTWSKSARSKP